MRERWGGEGGGIKEETISSNWGYTELLHIQNRNTAFKLFFVLFCLFFASDSPVISKREREREKDCSDEEFEKLTQEFSAK